MVFLDTRDLLAPQEGSELKNQNQFVEHIGQQLLCSPLIKTIMKYLNIIDHPLIGLNGKLYLQYTSKT